jgi:basic amino acid/polyamine antiporter, APA family
MEHPTELKRSLGLIDSTMIVAGSMIGSGIFIVTPEIARNVGGSGWVMLAWIIAGIVTIIAALSYGELAGMMPKAGGQYIYLREAYNSLTGFVYGWTLFMVIQTATIAAVAVGFAKFTSVFIPKLSYDNIIFEAGFFHLRAAQLFAICMIAFLTIINLYGVNIGKTIQTFFTSTKLLALFGLIITGFIVGSKGHLLIDNFKDMWSATSTSADGKGVVTILPLTGMGILAAMGVAMVGSLFSSDAWNNVTFIAGEIKNPHKNIPRSLFFGTLIVSISYILANVVYLSVLPVHGTPTAGDVFGHGIQFAESDRVGTAAAEMIFGNGAVALMAILIMVSTFGCNNGLILSGARVYYAMAKDKLFFKQAGVLNSKGVPANSLIYQGIWTSILCLSGTYYDLITYTIFAALIFYILTIAGVFILRKKQPDTPRPYKAWGYPIVPAFYILVALAICIDLLISKPMEAIPGLIIVLLGIPVYYWQKRTKDIS